VIKLNINKKGSRKGVWDKNLEEVTFIKVQS
jgi:hypothetical protein